MREPRVLLVLKNLTESLTFSVFQRRYVLRLQRIATMSAFENLREKN